MLLRTPIDPERKTDFDWKEDHTAPAVTYSDASKGGAKDNSPNLLNFSDTR